MKVTRVAFLLLALLICLGASAFAGKNAGGALIVHTDDTWNDTMFPPDYCQWYDPETCEEANTQSNFIDPNGLMGALVWVYAAFPEGSAPGVSAIHFGIEHNFPYGYILGWSVCGPESWFETPDAGWPDDWELAGNTVTLDSPVTDDRLFKFYFLGCYGDAGDYIGTGIHPALGYAGFVSDDEPGVLDETDRFGQLRWFEPGFNDCPEPLILGACCFDDGSCQPLYENQCIETGGYHWIVELSCDPNPCIPADVQDTKIEILPWGKIKAQYH